MPTEPGYYWHQWSDGSEWHGCLVEIREGIPYARAAATGLWFRAPGMGEWLGPTNPEDAPVVSKGGAE